MGIVAIQDTFLDSFSQLPKTEQIRAKKVIDALRGSERNQLKIERMKGSLDPKVHMIRVSPFYRMIVVRPEHEDVTLLVWIDRDEEAYRWAQRKRFVINKYTGSLQMWTSIDTVPEINEKPGLFANYTDHQLLRLGVPEDQLSLLRSVTTEQEFRKYKRDLPIDAFENLARLLNGTPYEKVLESVLEYKELERAFSFEKAVTSGHSSRHIAVITDDEILKVMLDKPFERWRTFLHPDQRELVEKDYKGPVRVLGGAGTGKTVVVMHRAQQLVSKKLKPDDRVLVTTYTPILANHIRSVLSTMCTEEEMERVDVLPIDQLAKQIVEKVYDITVKMVDKEDARVKSLWKEAAQNFGWAEEDLAFLKSEYHWVIQQGGAETWQEYLSTSRTGRKKRISRAQKKKVWDTAMWFRQKMEEKGLYESVDVLRKARIWLEENPDRYTYRYRSAIIDEAQDFHPEAFKLIRALVPENENDLFIVGDAHQRIYSRQVVLSKCGIHVRGKRSKRLTVNYRTTEEIREKAIEVINFTVDGLDGDTDDGIDISLLSGVKPEIKNFAHANEEKEFVVDKVKELLEEDLKPNEIAVLARFDHTVDSYMKAFGEQRIESQKIASDTVALGNPSAVICGTMHSCKGLEFRVVFLVEANEEVIPPEWELDSLEDEDDKKELIKLERSLIYVAITRARDRVFITSFGSPSKLLVKDHKQAEAKKMEEKNDSETAKGEERQKVVSSVSKEKLLDQVMNCSPAFFEQLVIDLLIKMGYGGSGTQAGLHVGGAGDEGIDGIILEDPLGLHKIYVQAKRWKNPVGRPEIQMFVGALMGKNAERGVFITTSHFTAPAKRYVKHVPQNIVLIDGKQLVELMMQYDIGVGVQESKLELVK
ncbi:restriction endonuclease [Thermoflavimicrobium dichotomicum]|uniref:DNA 3'-5' helicase n=1 Tax=Thermoflavimicrobium dichotomicum TaxID=46223 RepID=A0A1I3SK12_9BACL|nr:restriction endonuclease [Thermoflavimicrobium dichotomicum]SFJ58750.1 UvrD-like helicase C-terminal domain-containing protein [Thermoflavimicrobium dichotomicum]